MHLIRNRSFSLLNDAELKENDKTDENRSDEKSNGDKNDDNSIKLPTKLTSNSLEQVAQSFLFWYCVKYYDEYFSNIFTFIEIGIEKKKIWHATRRR